MTSSCSTPISWEDLVSYWAHDLGQVESDTIDEHLMQCSDCTATSERVAAITENVRAMIPAFLSHERLEALRRRGVRIVENPVIESEVRTVVFTATTDVLLHRLRALDLTGVEAVEVVVSDERNGETLLVDPKVPFDPSAGEILVACQRHFGEIDRTIVFEVRAHDGAGATRVSRFAIPHVFERPNRDGAH